MIVRIEKAFGVSMDTLMRMQNSYDIAQARRRAGEIKVARFVGKPGDPAGEFGPGWADGSMTGFWFDPRTGMPPPDDPGQPQVPGTLLCRNVVTLNARHRETWVEASLEFRLPVFVGLTETLTVAALDQVGVSEHGPAVPVAVVCRPH